MTNDPMRQADIERQLANMAKAPRSGDDDAPLSASFAVPTPPRRARCVYSRVRNRRSAIRVLSDTGSNVLGGRPDRKTRPMLTASSASDHLSYDYNAS